MNSLERAAIAAHKSGLGWDQFWQTHGDEARAVTYDRRKFHRLFRRLLHLVTSGDDAGQFAVGDPDAPMPWEVDDKAEQNRIDGETHARIQLPLPLTYPEVTT